MGMSTDALLMFGVNLGDEEVEWPESPTVIDWGVCFILWTFVQTTLNVRIITGEWLWSIFL